jgi:hypothetical protein
VVAAVPRAVQHYGLVVYDGLMARVALPVGTAVVGGTASFTCRVRRRRLLAKQHRDPGVGLRSLRLSTLQGAATPPVSWVRARYEGDLVLIVMLTHSNS